MQLLIFMHAVWCTLFAKMQWNYCY